MPTIVMPSALTDNDLARRKDKITATDVPAIMGTSPWKTAGDVFLEKNTDVPPAKPTLAMMWGTLLEQPILTFAEAQLREHLEDPELKFTKVGTRRAHANGVMSCTFDARFGREDAIEAKTNAILHWHEAEGWGDEPFTDQVPDHYRDQVCAQFACTPEVKRVWVVVTIGRAIPTIYLLEREKLAPRICAVENRVCDFWDNHIIPDVPPEEPPTLELVKRVRQTIDPGKIVELPDDLLVQCKKVGKQLGELEKQKKSIDATIRTKLIGAELGRSPAGHSARINTVNKKQYTVAAGTYTTLNVKLINE